MAKIVKGSHLTVITNSNGYTELIWDWDALARDVSKAIATHEEKKKKIKKPKKNKD